MWCGLCRKGRNLDENHGKGKKGMCALFKKLKWTVCVKCVYDKSMGNRRLSKIFERISVQLFHGMH